MATHSSVLAWRIPWMEEPGRLESMELESLMTEATSQVHEGRQYLWGPNPRVPTNGSSLLTGLPGGQCGEVGTWGGCGVVGQSALL